MGFDREHFYIRRPYSEGKLAPSAVAAPVVRRHPIRLYLSACAALWHGRAGEVLSHDRSARLPSLHRVLLLPGNRRRVPFRARAQRLARRGMVLGSRRRAALSVLFVLAHHAL